MRKLKRNAMKCLKCGDVIESTHRHDFVSCSCESLFVDGGLAYCRFGGPALDECKFEDLCEWEEGEE